MHTRTSTFEAHAQITSQSEQAISNEHITNNEVVRTAMLERGIRPEKLPAAEDVRKVERRLASEELLSEIF